MKRIFASVRGRLLALVLLAVVPALALTLYTHLEERRLNAIQVQENALRLARLVSADQERLIEGARQLLASLARLPQVRMREATACSRLFAEFLEQYSLYANLGVASSHGDIFCSGLPISGSVGAAHRTWFQRTIKSGAFSVGDYQIGTITRKATVNFGYPVFGDRGGLVAVVFVALDLAWLDQLAAQARLPTGSVLTVIDRSGTVLVRYPGDGMSVGQPMPDEHIFRAILAQQGEGTTRATGADGVPRLFSFAPLGRAAEGGDAYVSIGIPITIAFAEADRRLARNLTALGLTALLALAAAWVASDLLVVRSVGSLVRATQRLSAGDWSARTGLPHGHGELGHLARAFDEMAESLEQAEARRRLAEELRRQNYELEQQNRSIQEANRLKTEFVNMVSHELRTPLTSVQGYVYLLLEGQAGRLGDEQQECLTVIKNNAERLLGLINDLLDISRIEAGRTDLHRTALDLAHLIRGVVSSFRPLIDAKRQALTVEISDALPAVWGDSARVTQILTNLVSNAQKYTPAGGRITIAAQPESGFARVDVRDTGVGLSHEEQARLFTKFFRGQNRATQGVAGTGLGLVITRALVELHGGCITVSSAPGQGSTFSFTLPGTTATPDVAGPDLPAAPALRGARVLVVDDEPDIANLMRHYLERAGLQVLLASGGAEALRLATAERLDLITLDILLRDMDGFTVLERLKSDPATAMIPVMLISILPDEGRGKLLGALDYLHKPVREHTMVERVNRILAGDRARRVLVAADDADVRTLLAGHLRQAGYEVVEATDGAEAVARAQQASLGLVLMDIRMRTMDGLAALRALRAEPTTRNLPVIMMTASPSVFEESRPAIEALGGVGLLAKPCTAEELATAIARGLSGAT